MDTSSSLVAISSEFLQQIEQFKTEWTKFYQNISNEETPRFDGTGKEIVRHRPDGYDYIEETHMRNMLDKHFPGWSWEMASPLYFLGAEWVVSQGHLCIIDPYLLKLGINPPIRKFYGVDSVRIQYRKQEVIDSVTNKKTFIPGTHIPENIVDVGDNCKQSNTAAMKYACNRLTHIGDDVYGKRMEYEGAGSLDDMIETNANAQTFTKWIGNRISWGEVMKILEVDDLGKITNWELARDRIKTVKNWK